MKTVIIKYNAGNIFSVESALTRLGVKAIVTDDKEEISNADKVIFPGVGEAGSAMADIKAKSLDKLIPGLRQPFLGICVGMQLLCSYSSEGDTKGIGVFDEHVDLFPPEDKVPHMGWNSVNWSESPLFKGLKQGCFVYFVHSYYASKGDNTSAEAEYILPFSAALEKGNFYAVQFHPEKSGETGAKILKNFLDI